MSIDIMLFFLLEEHKSLLKFPIDDETVENLLIEYGTDDETLGHGRFRPLPPFNFDEFDVASELQEDDEVSKKTFSTVTPRKRKTITLMERPLAKNPKQERRFSRAH